MPAPATPLDDSGTSFASAQELARRLAEISDPATPGHFDEARDEHGRLRPIWERFLALSGPQALSGLPEHARTIERLIQQNGVTHNVYDARQSGARPWSVNPLPLLIEPNEWRVISRGIAQRARLLNEILKDVYGPGHLLTEGLLPPALVKGHPGYLRALDQVRPASDIFLHIAAFDIARGPDGRWWVVSSRTQSPSGLGYVREHRLIVSRLFTEAFRGLRIQHIASSYRRLLTTLTELAQPLRDGEPLRFALLTPGPYNETYFEQAYLAGYLGLPLVEGGDLVTREDKLYLKTLQGLQRVHGLLRRLDDEFLDPLELRADSSLGVPGLVQVIRAGNVVMANALGAGFLESAAIQGFLPALSQRLLGEPLHMPSLDTWWCGESAALNAIAPRLHDQVIKPTYQGSTLPAFDPVIARTLDEAALAGLAERIRQHPGQYTAQSYLAFSQALTWQVDRLMPKTALLRVYAIAGTDGQWELVPGGMTRIASMDPHVVSLGQGGSTLDTWVSVDGEVDTFSMLPGRSGLSARARQTPPTAWRPVSSRVAENLFWLGRYTERADFMTRLAREVLMIASSSDGDLQSLQSAANRLAVLNGLVPVQTPSLSQSSSIFVRALIAAFKDPNAVSLDFYLRAIDNNLRLSRDLLPADHVRLAGAMRRSLSMQDPTLMVALEALDALSLQLAALTGLQTDRMTRDLGWRLLTLGRLIERLVKMSESLQAFLELDAVASSRGFDALLTIFDSIITYRARYQGRQEIDALIELLMFDDTNPRSLAWIVQECLLELSRLPDPGDELLGIERQLRALQPRRAIALNAAEVSEQLAVLGRRLSDGLSSQYFAHVLTRRTRS
ncbi:MAG: circularly permuted type 2 ATP-grasp protein [Burkholderiales bacterium]